MSWDGGQSGSGAMIVGFRNGNRIVRVSPDRKQMVQSDALSRRPDLCPDEDTDNEDKIPLPDTMFVRIINTELKDLIANNKQHDMVILEAIWAL